MTAHQAAELLHISMHRLAGYVYQRRLRPEQPITDRRSHAGVGLNGWTFTEAEIDRFRVARAAANERRRQWNGAKPGFEVAA